MNPYNSFIIVYLSYFYALMMRRFLVSFLLITASCKLFSQVGLDSIRLNFETFSTKEGLSQGMVRSLIQDKEGYMWFATKDGLNKFDGYHITVYRNNAADPFSLPDNYVTQLVEDENGNFWVGTSTKGLYLFDKKHEKFYHVTAVEIGEQLENNDIDFMQCQNGHLLMGRSSDIYMYDVSKLRAQDYSTDNLNNIKQIFSYNDFQEEIKYKYSYRGLLSYQWMPDNKLWVCFQDKIIIATPDATLNNWMKSEIVLSALALPVNDENVVHAIHLKISNKYLITNSKWVAVYDAATNSIIYKTTIEKKGILNSKPIPDADGNIILENGEVMYRFDPASYTLKKVISNNPATKTGRFSSAIDRNGILWLGTPGQGVLKYDKRKELFRSNFHSDKTLLNAINNKLVVLKNNNDINTLNPLGNNFDNLFPPGFAKQNWNSIGFLTITKNEEIWFTTSGFDGTEYLLNYKPENKKIIRFKLSLHSIGKVYALFSDNENQLWALIHCTDNKRKTVKLNKENGEAIAAYTFPIKNDLNEYPFISQHYQDKNGNFWFGTMQGLFKFNEKNSQWYQWKNNPGNKNSLSTNMIFSICADTKEPEKFIWLGTNGAGLNQFDIENEKFVRYNIQNGLPNNVVYGILPDETGNLWLSTNKGISCFNTTNKSFRNFSQDDGLFGDEFNRYEFAKLKNGDLAFGGIGGFVVFNPMKILEQKNIPEIVFTDFFINNKSVDWKTDSSILNSCIGYTKSIRLEPEQDIFTISFSTLNFGNNDKTFYKYYLEGYDKNWTEPSNKNEATYTNLSPGDYVLHVKGTNGDGVWSKEGNSIRIIVLPYWYQTWWFKLIIFQLVLSILYLIYKYRLKQALKLYTLRNNIASDLHDEIGSTLSSISLSSLIIQKKIKDDTNQVLPLLDQITTNTDNMMEAMSDIVWSINTKNDHFDNVTNRMCAFAIELLEPLNCTTHFTIDPLVKDIKLNMGQRKNIYLLFKEAIHNTAKYAEAKNVWVDIRMFKNISIEMRIKDDGIGFTKNSGTEINLGGNGLINMEKRTKELNGKLIINTENGKGTEVVVVFKR